MTSPESSMPANVPQAVLKPKRSVSLAWLLPAAAIIAAAWLGGRAWSQRGVPVTVVLADGHGLKVGDAVRYRGIAVGEVRQVTLDDASSGIRVTIALRSEADRLARTGSRFWVVRPQFGLSRTVGLETLVGPRYLAVLPGRGASQRHFIGLNEPPIVERRDPGDLEIILTATALGSLRRGAPVMYRQVPVGTILSVGLMSDGGGVEARVHIDRAYAQLIRSDTRFWDVGGLDATVGLTGVNIRVENLEALLAGGVALATPPGGGEAVGTGYRFALSGRPPEGWLQWQPMAVIGSSLLPSGAPLPSPRRATVAWTQGRLISRQRHRQGWVLQTDQGLLGPADLLVPDDDADKDSTILEVAGTVVPLDGLPRYSGGGLAILEGRLIRPAWPSSRYRRAAEPEECLAIGDPTAPPIPLAAARLTATDGGASWDVDPAISLDESWHGAAVVARIDGNLVGILLVKDDMARVAMLPEK
ncbi:MAG: MCE family protein [Planctomycetota bacterium]|nr:MAG: MCE family protein [Planctomycetota bacterium]